MSQVPSYHIVFSRELIEKIEEFTSIYHSSHITIFKPAWAKWIEKNKQLIINEKKRLNNNCDIYDKLFECMRYYYSKKAKKQFESDQQDEGESSTRYCMSPEFLQAVQTYITTHFDLSIKPTQHFTAFCTEYKSLLKNEILHMCKLSLSEHDIKDRIKKSFKNKYATYRRQITLSSS